MTGRSSGAACLGGLAVMVLVAGLAGATPDGTPSPEARREALARCRSPAALETLAGEFFASMDLSQPGLAAIPPLLARRDYDGALEAYRRYFFDKLLHPEAHGVPMRAEPRKDVPYLDESDWAHWGGWSDPSPKSPTVDDLLRLERPVDWCKSDRRVGGLAGPLLRAYAETGEPECLRAWADIMDDWSLHFVGDMEASPDNLRQYYVHEVGAYLGFLGTLRAACVARPELALALPADTLARALSTANAEYPAASIRMCRSVVQNHRAEGVACTIRLGAVLDEFHVGQFCLREGRKLLELNSLHRLSPDGASMEYADWGHEHLDQMALGPLLPDLFRREAPWNTPEWRTEVEDPFLLNARFFFRLLPPDGLSEGRGSRSIMSDYLVTEGTRKASSNRCVGATYRVAREMFADPAWAALLSKVYGVTEKESPASPADWQPFIGRYLSDFMAYSGHYYFRQGWDREDQYAEMLSKARPSSNYGNNNTVFRLQAFGFPVLRLDPVRVDGHGQNEYLGVITDPGVYYKTDALVHAPDTPIPARWHCSPRHDVAEGLYSGGYQAARRPGADAPKPIEDVRAARQVFFLRPQAAWILVDRVQSPVVRAYAQRWDFPLRQYTAFAQADQAVTPWPDRHQLEVAPADFPAISLRQFATSPLTCTSAPVAVRPEKPKPGALVTETHHAWTASWRGSGPQAVVTLLVPQRGTRRTRVFHEAGEADFSYEGYILAVRGEQVDIMALAPGDHRRPPTQAPGKGDFQPGPVRRKIDAFIPGDQDFIRSWRPGEEIPATGMPPQPIEASPLAGDEGTIGFEATLPDGCRVAFLTSAGDHGLLKAGAVRCVGQALLLVATPDGATGGIALGCRSLAVNDKPRQVPADCEFALAKGTFTVVAPIHRPIEPLTFTPEEPVFTDNATVTIATRTPEVEIRYTTDRTDPTPTSPLYKGPLTLTESTYIKARGFRAGLREIPMDISCTRASVVAHALFTKKALAPATPVTDAQPGLRFEYLEGSWLKLFTHSAFLPGKTAGTVPALFDLGPRTTDGAFTIRYAGHLNVPRDGVYTFHAPHELVYPDMVSSYDLRVFVDDEEWYPATRRHAQGTWSVPLARGLHPFKVIFTDFRLASGRLDLWRNFGLPHTLWKGSTPSLEISGPGLEKQPIPDGWLSHRGPERLSE